MPVRIASKPSVERSTAESPGQMECGIDDLRAII
jgi:hypothetical protein